MECKECREVLSARLDNEAEPASLAAIDEHLSGCSACRRWQAEATMLTRALRVGPAVKTPDLVAAVLNALEATPTDESGEQDQSRRGDGA